MVLSRIEISNFRNISSIECDFSQRINFLFGDNAQGKTNLIEAIYHLCLARSFRTRDESELVRFGSGEFVLEGDFVNDMGIVKRVGVSLSRTQGKRVKIDG
jgi:DNA replication and repair protein RecF